jgi:hypothetical protein
MNRASFLQSLSVPALLVNAVPNWLLPQSEPAKYQNEGLLNKASNTFQAVYLYSGFIAGLQYYSASEILTELRPGLIADLVREPQNAYDYKAVAVYALGQKLGYLQRRHNLVLCNILDAGLPIYAEISRVNPEAVSYEQVRLRLYLVGLQPNQVTDSEDIKPGLSRLLELKSGLLGTYERVC